MFFKYFGFDYWVSFFSVHFVTRPRRQQRQEEQNSTEQNRRNNHDNDSHEERSLWKSKRSTSTRSCRGRRTFLDVLPGPAAPALFGFLLSVKCNAHVTRAPQTHPIPSANPQPREDATKSQRRRRTASPFLIIFQSCPRLASATKISGKCSSHTAFGFVLFCF